MPSDSGWQSRVLMALELGVLHPGIESSWSPFPVGWSQQVAHTHTHSFVLGCPALGLTAQPLPEISYSELYLLPGGRPPVLPPSLVLL